MHQVMLSMESLSAPDICANCGKGEEEIDNLKSCAACKLLKYCSRDCQAAHRPQHKKACKKRAIEIYDEKLFKEVEPDECPLCMLPILSADQTTVHSCCGKRICDGCIFAMVKSGGKDLCPFCRKPPPDTDEEEIERTKKLIDKGNAEACFLLAAYYTTGSRGLPRDNRKANELFLKAGKFGSAGAYYNLGNYYRDGSGVEVDKKKAKHYFELAAMSGYVPARHNLACLEVHIGNERRALKHWIIAARAGDEKSLNAVKTGFMKGLVTKEQYASALRACHERQKELKNEERDMAALVRGLRNDQA